MRRVILIAVAAAAAISIIWVTSAWRLPSLTKGAATKIGAAFAKIEHGSQAPPQYKASKVLHGDIESVVSATGAVRAVTLVPVGSQVSGRIKEILADYNSSVKKGQPVATIEPDVFQAKVDVAKADLEQAKAAAATALAELESKRAQVKNMQSKLEEAKASLEKSEVAVEDAVKNQKRREQLFLKRMISESDLDSGALARDSTLAQKREAVASLASYEAQLDVARLEVKVAEARHRVALAQVERAEAALKTADIDLSHTIIYSPVNGIVISRDVDVGQTVAASLQAPLLFTIAEDLSLMQVITSVDEADIGGIQEDQKATFTVDAYPNRSFEGKVIQVRNVPRESQNVVTYDVVIEVPNSDFKLKPGMTANVSIIKASRQGVLKVPAAALRFKPPSATEDKQEEKSAPAAESSGPPSPQKLHQTLTAELQLTQGQQEQLSQIFTVARQQFMALPKEGPGLDAKREQIRANSRRRIRSILNEEQKSKFDRLTEAWDARRKAAREGGLKARVWVLSTHGELQQVPVLLGISDDSYYELIKGDLKEGQEVVVGAASAKEQKKKSTPPGFSPLRLR